MPLYDYKCDDEQCGRIFESLSVPYEPVECPFCKLRSTTRLISCHSSAGINTMKNPGLKEEARKEGKRERLTEYYANDGKWGSSQKHD